MDATSNTTETGDEEEEEEEEECSPTGHDRQETEDHAASTAGSNLPSTTAEENVKILCCNDEVYKRKLDDLKMNEKETCTRLETVERRLTQTEAKMRSCDDMLVLIGLLADRIERFIPEVGPFQGGGEDAPKGQTDFATVPRAN